MTSNPAPDLAPVPFQDAEWLAHRYDRMSDAIQFRHLPRLRHLDGPFLTDEYIGDVPLMVRPRGQAVAAAPGGRLHFVFHSAFCASTMVVRALDHPGMAMGLSEPVILNDIVGIRRRGEAQPPEVARLLEDAMTLLARPFSAGEAVIVKPSNILNTLAGGMLAIRLQAQALLLHAPLEVFLTSVARKGLWCRLWARELLEGLLREGTMDLGFAQDDYFRQSDLQVAAVGWLAQHQIFHRLIDRFGPERVRTLDSETLIARPDTVMPALLAHYGLDAAYGPGIAKAAAFTRHSKSGQTFASQDRVLEHAQAKAAYGEEIEKVAAWARAVARNAGVDLDFPQQSRLI